MPQRLFVILLLFSSWLPAQQATNEQVLARAELANREITIGDQIWMEVNVSAPPGTEVSGLQNGYLNTLPGLESLRETNLNVVAQDPELLLQQRFLITSFDTGYIAVPPLPFVFKSADGRLDTAYTNDLLLRVKSFPVNDDDDLRPIKPIIEEPLNWLDFWPLYLLIALGAVAYGIWTYFKRQQRQAPPPPPPPPPHIIALGALEKLEAKELWQQERTKEYYSELTRILREYLEGRFDLQAMEMTTRQITSDLRQRADFDSGQEKELSNLLQLSDLVKFAQAKPAEELHPQSLARVKSFVRDTKSSTSSEGLVLKPSIAPAAAPIQSSPPEREDK